MALPEENPELLQRIRIGHFDLTVRSNDGGGTHYLQRGHSEEYHSAFYRILRQCPLNPSYCIDIGANYGFTGLLMRHHFPDALLTLVEPVPWLRDFIIHNFEENGSSFDALHSAICSDHHGGTSGFGVRDTSSQDSRVVLQTGMREVETEVVSVSGLAAGIPPEAGVYLKIDTQGWEEHVFAGAEAFLETHQRWFIKTEFAPSWLESQGTDPVMLLRRMTGLYDVFEAPGRQRWQCDSLEELTGPALRPGCEKDFVHHVRNLAREDKGWIDLYVMPKAAWRRSG